MLEKVWLIFLFMVAILTFHLLLKSFSKPSQLKPSYPLKKSTWDKNGHLETGSLNIRNRVTKYLRKKWKLKCGNTIRYFSVYCGSYIHFLKWVRFCTSINWRETVLGYIHCWLKESKKLNCIALYKILKKEILC